MKITAQDIKKIIKGFFTLYEEASDLSSYLDYEDVYTKYSNECKDNPLDDFVVLNFEEFTKLRENILQDLINNYLLKISSTDFKDHPITKEVIESLKKQLDKNS